MDDINAGIIAAVLLALSICGTLFLIGLGTATSLPNTNWNCTEVAIHKGKPQCIKYERVYNNE